MARNKQGQKAEKETAQGAGAQLGLPILRIWQHFSTKVVLLWNAAVKSLPRFLLSLAVALLEQSLFSLQAREDTSDS